MSSLPPKDGVIGRLAAARTRERITAMVPLIWLAQRRENRIGDCAVPHLVKAEDVPVYALDKHTRLGREPIWRFACENDSARVSLARFVPPSQRRSAAYVAAFLCGRCSRCQAADLGSISGTRNFRNRA
jgi:hypothetical protein